MSINPKDPAEIVTLSYDFASLTATPSSPVVTISVLYGIDADVAAMLTGAPALVGTKVLQQISAGLAGVDYTVRYQVDAPDGDRYVEAQKLMVRTAK